ncbi:MAG: SGNH/GDSL hydrolase family protein [Mucinivorans sp.]
MFLFACQHDNPIIFHGSSITQGAAPSHPSMAYPFQTMVALNHEVVNLGFSGRCRLNDEMVDFWSSNLQQR